MSETFERYCEIKDEETLTKVVAHWQQVLRLQDWKVRAYFTRVFDLEKNALAQCHAEPTKRVCDIPMMLPDERLARATADDGKRFMPMETMECSVVHELLHIYTVQMGLHEKDAESKEYIAMEQMVDALACALTGLHSYFDARDLAAIPTSFPVALESE